MCYALQVFALHPLYLSLTELAPSNMPADIARSVDEARQEVDGPVVDYERTLALKLAIARRIFHTIGQAELKVLQDSKLSNCTPSLQPSPLLKWLAMHGMCTQ